MKKTLYPLIIMVFLSSLAFAQNYPGIALDEVLPSLRSNPANLGFGKFLALGYSLPTSFDPDSSNFSADPTNFRFWSYNPLLAAFIDRIDGVNYFGFLSGFTLWEDYLSVGYEYVWEELAIRDGTWKYGLTLRPFSMLSMAATADYRDDGFTNYTLGAAIRPLGLIPEHGHRLSLFADYQPESNQWLAIGATAEPLDGLSLAGGFNPVEESWFASLALRVGIAEIGAWQNSASGGTYLGFNAKDLPSLGGGMVPKVWQADEMSWISDAPANFFFGGGRDLLDVLGELEEIREDPSLEAVVFTNQLFITGRANRMEIAAALERIKESGKEIYFYFDVIDLWGYALAASVADEIWLAPMGYLEVSDLSYSRAYFGALLDRFGITFNNFHTGDFKSSGFGLSEATMPDAERSALQDRLDNLQSLAAGLIQKGRAERLLSQANELMSRGPYLYGQAAQNAGLVDRLGTEEEFRERVEELHPTALWTGRLQLDRPRLSWGAPMGTRVAIVYATGNIVMGEGVANQSVGNISLVNALDQLENDPSVGAIILRVNSPGGSALSSDLIARKVAQIVESGKPVIVSMGEFAASGGYYISAPATEIFTSPATLTGSIGVVILIPEISRLLEEWGVDAVRLSGGDSPGELANPYFELTDEQRELINEALEANYQAFLETVSEGREIPLEEVRALAEGRVWTGIQAQENGLADQVGGLWDTLEAVKGLLETDSLVIEQWVPGSSPSLLSSLFGFLGLETALSLPENLQEVVDSWQELAELETGVPLYYSPGLE